MKVYRVYTDTKDGISLHIDKKQAEYTAAKFLYSHITTRNVAKCYLVIEHFHDYRGVDRDDVIGVFYDYKRAKALADVAYKYHVGKHDSKVIIRMMYDGGSVEIALQERHYDCKEKFYLWCMENGKWKQAKMGYVENDFDIWPPNVPIKNYPKPFPIYDIHKAYRALKKMILEADLSNIDYIDWVTHHSDYDKQKRTGTIWIGGDCDHHYTKEQALKCLEAMYDKEKQPYKPDEYNYSLVVSEDGDILQAYHNRTHPDSYVGKSAKKLLDEGCHVEQYHGTIWEVEQYVKNEFATSCIERFETTKKVFFKTIDEAVAEVKRLCETDKEKYVSVSSVRWGGNIVFESIGLVKDYARYQDIGCYCYVEKRYKVTDNLEETRQNHINALKQILEEEAKVI